MSFVKKLLASVIFIFLMEGSLLAQQNALYQHISIRFRNISVDSALRILENKIHLDLTYNSNLVPQNKTITANFDSIPLSIILDSLLQRPLIQYRILDNQLIFYEKSDTTSLSTTKIHNAKTVVGKIVDRVTNKTLPYSSISILHKNIGVISNEDGIFMFKIPSKYFNDTLVISHLGYFLYTVPVPKIKDFKIYKMNVRSVSLPEILIRNTSASELVKRAISKIPENYFSGPYMMRSFYREIVKRDNKYMSYTEAILDIYKRPMRPTLFHDEVKLVKERKYTEIRPKDTVAFKLKGGIEAILNLDIIRNPLGFIQSNNSDYQYNMINMEFLGGRLVYVISFTPKEESDEPEFEGEMFIDSETMAILQIRFGYSRKSLKKLKDLFIVKTGKNIKSYPIENSYEVSYQSFDGKYYVHHILGNIGLKVKRKKKWLPSHYNVTFEMVGTDIENKSPIRFVASQTIKPNRIFSDMISGSETTFWQNDNIILPETDITKALRKFKMEDLEIKK
ncbi:MAG: carboxypeptidase-like regulatory domain-containing protein [Bacteroidales bacterium]|nr:carboxypeptidase-like regulatory domain-containing protein [Bacteroidales bacterium]